MRIWFGILSNYDYDDAQKAVEYIYANGLIKYQKQLVPVFIKQAKIYRIDRVKAESNIKGRDILLYSMQSEDNPRHIQRFFLSSKATVLPSEDAILREAEQKRELFCRIYGGNWVIVRDWVSLLEPPF